MTFCSNCGKEISDDARFCQHCGFKRAPTAAPPVIVDVPASPEPVTVTVPKEPELNASTEEMCEAIRLCKDVIPDHLEKEWAKLLKAGDEAAMRSMFSEKIVPLLVQHESMAENTKFNPGEEVQWIHEVHKGVFKRTVVEKWIITNQRAILLKLNKYLQEQQGNLYEC